MSDFREVQIKTYLNLISCTKISKPYLNDKYFLQRILNSQIDKYRNKLKDMNQNCVDRRQSPYWSFIDDRGFTSL